MREYSNMSFVIFLILTCLSMSIAYLIAKKLYKYNFKDLIFIFHNKLKVTDNKTKILFFIFLSILLFFFLKTIISLTVIAIIITIPSGGRSYRDVEKALGWKGMKIFVFFYVFFMLLWVLLSEWIGCLPK